MYTEKVKNKIINRIPTKRSTIEEQMISLRDEIRAHYLKLTYDESSTSPVDELIQNIFKQVIRLNEEETKVFLKNNLTKEYEPYAKKLFSHFYGTYEEFEKDLKNSFRESVLNKLNDKIDGINEAL